MSDLRIRRRFKVLVARLGKVVDWRSLRTQILGFAVLAALIPSLTTAWISYTQTKQSLTQRVSEELQAVSSQAARETDLWIKALLVDLRTYSGSFEVIENMGTSPAANRRLRDYLGSVQDRSSDLLEELVAIRANGSVAATSAPPEAPAIPDDWSDGGGNAPTIVGAPYWDEWLGKPIIAASVPVTNADGDRLGWLFAKLNPQGLQTILADFEPSGNGALLFVQQGGSYIFTSRESSAEIMGVSLDDATRDALFASGATTLEFLDHQGVESIGVAQLVPRSPFAVVALAPTFEAFADVRRLTNIMFFITTGIIVVVGAIAYHLGLLIVRPLDRLRQGAAEVAKGDLAVELPIESGGEVGYLTEVFNDMVQRLQQGREELERLSITDGLTGLFNRRHMIETLESESNRTKRMGHGYTIIMLDVDHFKRFNDEHGHQAGDTVLVRVSEILRKVTRAVDYAARYGGEEFLMMLPETTMERALPVAERIRNRLKRQKFDVGGAFVSVTASLGMAEFPKHGRTASAVIGAADAALYEAKGAGRDQVHLAPAPEPAEQS